MKITDTQVNAKYESGINRLVLEHDRIKLPELVDNIKLNPNYMMIDSDWSSTWDEITKSRLIESLLINIPVMPIILYEKERGSVLNSFQHTQVSLEYKSYEVIDGKERLKTVVDFYSDRLKLTGLEVETNKNSCTYSTLPTQVKDKLNNCSLNLINCIPASEEQSELEIKKLIDAVKERL